MRNFIDKYRVAIGIILVLIILAAGLILVFEKNKLNLYKPSADASSENNDEMIKKISDLEERVKKLEESGTVKSAESSESTSGAVVAGKININTADAKTLDSLPGIGEKRAADIISYREANGGFKTTSEIKNIKGIGDSIYGQIKDTITVGD